MTSNQEIIVVTGCSGNIGQRMNEKFKNSPFHLIELDINPPEGKMDNCEFIQMDLSSKESIQKAFEEIKRRYGDKLVAVVHLAAYYNFAGGEWEKYENITIKGTERLLNELKKFDVEQFIFSSSMLVHAPLNPPQKINENSPLAGSWEYPLSKIKTEKIIREKHGSIPFVILRIAGCYDDECHSIPIAHQIKRIFENQFASHFFPGDISHGASYVHYDDVANALFLTIQKRHELPTELTLLIGEEDTLSYDQLQRLISPLIRGQEIKTYRVPKWFAKIITWIQNHIPFKEEPFIKPWMIDRADDNYMVDISRAKQYLGWQPTHSLSQTIPLMIQNLKNDPFNWYKINHLNPHSQEKGI